MHPAPRRKAERSTGTDWVRTVLRPIVFLDPDRVVSPPSWLEHVPFAFWLIDVLRPRVFVELGTHSGNSYGAFAQAVEYLGFESRGYSIDTWKGDPHAGFYDESVYTDWRNYHDRRYASFSALIRSTFDEAAAHFPDHSADLLNIDGYHTIEAVSHDFQTWLPKVSAGGVVLMHDINVREGNFGVWRAWAQLRDAYPSFEFLHGHGLGVLAVGPEVPPEIAWLTGLDPDDTAAIVAVRQFFARAGATVMARFLAEANEEDSRRLAAELAARTSELAARTTELAARTTELAARTTELADLTGRLDAEIAREAQLSDELGARSAQISALDRQLLEANTGAEAAVADLTKQLQDASARNDALLRDLSSQAQARLAQESLRPRADRVAARQIDSLRARLRMLGGTRRPVEASRVGRFWATLGALGLAPSQLIRHPRRLGLLARLAVRPRAFRDASAIVHSGLFDAEHYRRRSPDVAESGLQPLAHFVFAGGAEGRSPHPLFDTAWYPMRYADVAAARANPLVHYLRAGAAEGRDPHPLFSVAYYRTQFVEGGAPLNPLQHYVREGVFEDRSPHPLFDRQHYVETYGDTWDVDPFVHFLEAGAAANFNPHPLFDVAYYRAQVHDLEPSQNPLRHYLEPRGASRTGRPHPLFDPTFYLTSYPDVAAAGVEPLIHFITIGGLEGRRPVPDFDSAWYLASYPDVAESRANPLIHFVQRGWLEGRNPSPRFDTLGYLSRHPDVVGASANPLVHYLECGRAEGRIALSIQEVGVTIESAREAAVRLRTSNLDGSERVVGVIVCLSHVMPLPPRAGNEYRIHRMLRWLRQAGYIVILVVAPNDSSRPTAADVRALADAYGNAVVCHPDGQLEYLLRDVPDVLQSLQGESPHRWATLLGEDHVVTAREREVLAIDHAFCTDIAIATVLRLQLALGPYVLLAEYIWMSRVLPLVGHRALKIIDTIDVFSTRAEKVGQYGVQDLVIEPDEERARLARADLIVAIQENERTALEVLAPGIPIVTSGVDFDITVDPGTPVGRRVLYVASANPMNRRGLRDFLRFAWPHVRERVPEAELVIAGAVGEAVTFPPGGVQVLGKVADLRPLYGQCRVAINPAMAGTGVKIKTLEALSYLRPIVTWPNGVDGLSPDVASLCRTVGDWYTFAQEVSMILQDERPSWFSAEDRATLTLATHPDRVYADLGGAIKTFLENQRASASGDADHPS
jgi:Methyltransferase domain/Glycosyl transferases group 1